MLLIKKLAYLCKVNRAQNTKQNKMNTTTKMTITKKFANKAFMFIYSAEIGKNWELVESYEAGNGQTWIKSSWKKYVNYQNGNTLLNEIQTKTK